MDLSRELTSRYADGQVTEQERLLVEGQLADDPRASLDLDEYKLIEDLFGHADPESVSDECLERLYALDHASDAPSFERIQLAPIKHFRWGGWAAAAAAVLLAFVGISRLTHKPDVTLRDFARLSLDADGAVLKTESLAAVTLRTGAELVAGPRERITYRDALGARVVLMPDSRLTLGDPREGELFELDAGTALLTVYDGEDERLVRAGRYLIRSQGADFGVRVNGSETRSAGAALAGSGLWGSGAPQVTVAVRAGYCEVTRSDAGQSDADQSGDREQIEAQWRVVLRHGSPAERSRLWEDPLFHKLLRPSRDREILPGFYAGEAGVRPIRLHGWNRISAHEHELVVSDNQAASVANWLVFEVSLKQASALELIMTRPLRGKPGSNVRSAEETVVQTPVVPAGRRIVAIPLDSLNGVDATRREIEIRADRSRLVRLRLRLLLGAVEQSNNRNALDIKASLWSARPPAKASKAIK